MSVFIPGYLSFFPPTVCFFLLIEFGKKLPVHSLRPPGFHDFLFFGIDCSWAIKRWTSLFFFFPYSTLSHGILYSKQIFEDLPLSWNPGLWTWFHLSYSFQDPVLHHLTVLAAKAAFDFHLPNRSLSVNEYGVQQSTCPHLSVGISHCQYIPATSWIAYVLLYCPLSGYWGAWSPSWRPGPANMRLLLYICLFFLVRKSSQKCLFVFCLFPPGHIVVKKISSFFKRYTYSNIIPWSLIYSCLQSFSLSAEPKCGELCYK